MIELENIEKMLVKLLENQEKMQDEISGIKSDISSMQGDICGIQKDITKQGIIQEIMARDIELLAEGHRTILEQNDRQHNEIRQQFNDRLEEIETAITNLSEDVVFIKHKEYKNEENIFKIRESLKKGKDVY